jgi:catechol-2,3-dioxygenase
VIDPRAAIGEVHLTISDLDRSLRFYQTHLGFTVHQRDTVMQGAADHGVSEALYLADPDGNGIEVYRDRPRAEWPYAAGALAMSRAIGLRHFIARLPNESAVSAVVDRLRAASVPFEATGDGMHIHDPAGNAMMLKSVA